MTTLRRQIEITAMGHTQARRMLIDNMGCTVGDFIIIDGGSVSSDTARVFLVIDMLDHRVDEILVNGRWKRLARPPFSPANIPDDLRREILDPEAWDRVRSATMDAPT